MPALPSAASFTGSTVTEAQFKSALTDLIGYLALLGTTGTQANALTALGAPLHSVLAKSTAYTILSADRGKLVNYSAAGVTCTLPTVAAAGAGFVVAIRNNAASGTLTIGRNSASIDGTAEDISLLSKESVILVCDGTGWQTISKPAAATSAVLLGIYSKTTAGSETPVRPTGTTRARIVVIGGGGAGGTGTHVSNGTGGGGGGYSEGYRTITVAPSVTVGAAGGTSSVSGAGATITATGGSPGGAGGTGTGGEINITGSTGSSLGNSGAAFIGSPVGLETPGAHPGSGGGGGRVGSWEVYAPGSGGAGAPGAVFIYWYK
jgi:hypothetical protein